MPDGLLVEFPDYLGQCQNEGCWRGFEEDPGVDRESA